MMDVSVSRCLAWAPDIVTPEDWRAWACGQQSASTDGAPAVGTVPAILRRRLTRWGRLALEVAGNMAQELTPTTPVIFSSRHGDSERTQQLLCDLAHSEPLSPTAFSLSVHNASLGLFTIVQQITAPSLALAAGKETFAHAWLEAITWLDQGAEQVLLVYADEPLAGFYQDDADEEELPLGLALLLTRTRGQAVTLGFSPTFLTNDAATPTDDGAPPRSMSMALEFLRWWFGDQSAFRFTGERLTWSWVRGNDEAI